MVGRETILAAVHDFVEAVLAPGARATLARLIAEHLPPLRDGDVIIDIGCGTHSRSGREDVVGIDRSVAAVRAFARRSLAVAGDACALPFRSSTAGAVISVGLLHHLSDLQAVQALSEMVRVTRPKGPVCAFDGVKPSSALRRPFPAVVRALDRGRFMRRAHDLAGLLDQVAAWDKQTMTYAASGLEGMLAVHSKP